MRRYTHSLRQQGFTLLELSVVLTIIALLVSGVLIGQDMVKQAELRSFIAQSDEVITAINSFKLRFKSFPGDMKTATRYWGVAGGTGSDSTCYDTDSTNANTTCNGNGSGVIDPVSASFTDNWVYAERFRLWQHLSLAGLIEGRYSGRTGPGFNNDRRPGTNLPAISRPEMGLSVIYKFVNSSPAHYFTQIDAEEFHTLSTVSNSPLAFTAEEMLTIDSKIDDGRPGSGSVFVFKGSSTWGANCADGDDPATARYSTNLTGRICNSQQAF